MIDLTNLTKFIGYGDIEAPVIFLGMEEGLLTNNDPAEAKAALLEDLKVRLEYQPTEDLFEAQRGLAGCTKWFGPHAKIQRTWRIMSWLMTAASGQTPSTERTRKYQSEYLGRKSGKTLLAELFPFPAPSTAVWPYSDDEFSPRFATREEYYAQMKAARLDLLRDAFAKAPRLLVVAYGKQHWPHYEQLWSNLQWTNDGVFRYGDDGSTRIILAPHFTSQAMNRREHALFNLAEHHLKASRIPLF